MKSGWSPSLYAYSSWKNFSTDVELPPIFSTMILEIALFFPGEMHPQR